MLAAKLVHHQIVSKEVMQEVLQNHDEAVRKGGIADLGRQLLDRGLFLPRI